MDTTDLSLMLSAFSALAIFIGPIAALVVVGFATGVFVGERRQQSKCPQGKSPLGGGSASPREIANDGASGEKQPRA
jgi:hypothetical protein